METVVRHPKSMAPLIVGVTLALTAVVSILGWSIQNQNLKSILPGLTPMNPMTAVCFLFLATAILIHHWSRTKLTSIATALSIAVVLVGGFRLVSSFYGQDRSIDTLLFPSRLDLELRPNRMANSTAVCALISGLSLLCFSLPKPKLLAAQVLSLVPCLMGVAIVNCYLFGIFGSQVPGNAVPMALNSAVLFSIFSVAIFALSLARGSTSALLQETNSAKLGRKLVLSLLFVPPILAVMTHAGSSMGLYRTEYSEAILITLLTAVIALLVWISTKESSRNELIANAAQQEADRANASKSEFLSRMSHELRTPLNSVIGYAQLLELQSTEAKILSAAGAISKSGKHLLSLINEILDLASIEAGKLPLSIEPVSIEEAIDQAVELVRPLAAARKIEISLDGESWKRFHAHADRQRVVQIILNLLTNAVKYNHESGKIWVRCVNHSDGTVTIEVEDSGYGISEEAAALLFNPFVRVGDTSIEGTGLGLALSSKLATVMGGDLHLVSSTSGGSIFGLKIKLVAPPLAIFGLEDLRNPDLPRTVGPAMKIVYIEDNTSNIELLDHVFEDSPGIQLLPVMTGLDGLACVASELPDLVLLDLNLPDIHGLKVLEQLKSDPRTKEIPVIVLSADATQNQISRLLKAGANAFLTKPLDLPALFDEVNKVRVNQKRAA